VTEYCKTCKTVIVAYRTKYCSKECRQASYKEKEAVAAVDLTPYLTRGTISNLKRTSIFGT